MTRYLLTLLIALGYCILPLSATASENLTFAVPVYWVEHWNTPGYFTDGGGFDGAMYDARLVYNPRVEAGETEGQNKMHYVRVEFPQSSEDLHFFFSKHLTNDPRNTAWWQAFALDEGYTSLWSAITACSAAWEHPVVPLTILHHMIATKVVTLEEVSTEFKEMSEARITQVMHDYTVLAMKD